jgi:uncharacterized iron-regulated membrane protein
MRWDFGAAVFDVAPREASYAPIGNWIQHAKARYPEVREIVAVAAPRMSPLPMDAALLTARLGDETFGFVTVDPYTGSPLGFFRYGEGLLFKTLNFHRHLLLPERVEEIGEEIVAWSGIVLLISVGSGLYLWWPNLWWTSGSWRLALTLSPGPRFLRSLHQVAAIYLLVPLVLLAVTGILLTKPEWLGRASQGARPAAAPSSAAREACNADDLTVDQMVALALAARPGSVFAGLTMPRRPGAPYVVRVRSGGSVPAADAGSAVMIDPRCGTVLPGSGPGINPRTPIQRLHADLMLGVVGQALVFVAGLVLPVLYVSGLWMWVKRKRRADKSVQN